MCSEEYMLLDAAALNSAVPVNAQHLSVNPSRALDRAKEAMIQQISSWPGVTVHEHRFGGVEFKLGRRELGHLHHSFADLPFPRPIRDELVASGHAKPHHVLPDSGWVTVQMRNPAEVSGVVKLFRQNYDRAVKPSQETPASVAVPFFY